MPTISFFRQRYPFVCGTLFFVEIELFDFRLSIMPAEPQQRRVNDMRDNELRAGWLYAWDAYDRAGRRYQVIGDDDSHEAWLLWFDVLALIQNAWVRTHGDRLQPPL